MSITHDDHPSDRSRSGETSRELCRACGGNGVVKIHHGVSVCPQCDGDCWEPSAASSLNSISGETPLLDRVKDYLRGAIRPQSVAAVTCEGPWDRGRRSGLQEALNAINAEEQKSAAASSLNGETREQIMREAMERHERALGVVRAIDAIVNAEPFADVDSIAVTDIVEHALKAEYSRAQRSGQSATERERP